MKYDSNDIQSILKALCEPEPWKATCISALKAKIKTFYLAINFPKCCYCQRSFNGEFKYVIDIEHILPKSKYHSHMFVLKNLNISCKRCNMLFKKDKDDFLSKDFNLTRCFDSKGYLLVHPNLDNVKEHIILKEITWNELIFKKYEVLNGSKKGTFTYNYFALNELECDNLTELQGGNIATPNSITALLVAMLTRNGL
ncbi:Uncharacterised protein [Plesiomonas shigelloides]|uniref:HNH endonuclease n=1 Tax=Plesiomonas shigelloides TaxID=703 RepID=UPI000DF9DF92|nr:HNH endonuclease [Plesiomonas shigelloides]SUB63574.1 Uncharacterised protein [Plesiomonas shigelloides]